MILTRPVEFTGHGLHGGRPARVRVVPGRGGSGLRFRLGGRDRDVATLEASGKDRSTRLEHGPSGEAVGCVEHLLAALSGLGLWDCVVVPGSDEIPVLDGSALGFAGPLACAAGPAPGPAAVRLARPVEVSGGAGVLVAEPADSLSLDVSVTFDHPLVGSQSLELDVAASDFLSELAPARTFGFLEEVEELRSRGLASGGGLDCALVFGPEGPLNPEGTRFPDEPVRHKALDLLGDLALLGRPLAARVRATRPSHALNQALVGAIRGNRE